MRIVWIAGIVGVVACHKAPAPLPRAPMPAGVLGVVRLPSPEQATRDALALVQRLVPAEAESVPAELVALSASFGGDGIARDRPCFVVLMAPAPGVDDPAAVAVVAARDVRKIEQAAGTAHKVRASHGWAVVGPGPEVDEIGAWALGTLATEPAPTTAHATLYPAAFAARWSAEAGAALVADDLSSRLAREVGLPALEQAERVEIDVVPGDADWSLELTLVPRPGTTLASVLAAQRAADFDLLEHLPLDESYSTMGGTVTLGPLSAPAHALLDGALGELGPWAPLLRQIVDTLWTQGTGELGAGTLASGAMLQAYRVAGAGAVADTIATLLDRLRERAAKESVTLTLSRADGSGGVVIHRASASVPDMPPDILAGEWAGVGDTIALVMPALDGSAMRATVEALRGTPSVPPGLAAVLDQARRRRDSLVQVLDFLPGDQPMIVVGAGVRDGALVITVSAPVDQLARLVELSRTRAAAEGAAE
jgi:hypothetical protein